MFYLRRNGWSLSFVFVTLLTIIGICIDNVNYSYASKLLIKDHFIDHKSIEPFYKEYNVKPNVKIHVREVVMAGQEKKASMAGKVLLLIHGRTNPGYTAFDLDHDNCSIMRYLARGGWDTFALDFEGHGLSTKLPLMDDPEAYKNSKAPINTEVAINDVERVFDFISKLRGVKKVHILGWSLGASREAPIYTIRHQDTVSKLVLFAPAYGDLGVVELFRSSADTCDREKVLINKPSVDKWYRMGSMEENLVPGAFEVFKKAILASDKKSKELGDSFRVPQGRWVDMLRAKKQFDASKIKVPTLVMRGELDPFGTRHDCEWLVKELSSEGKKFVEIPNAGHTIPYEKTNTQFYKTAKDFLEE